jgi:hypothetical protein
MRIRTRKFVGAVALLALVIGWPLFTLGFANAVRGSLSTQIVIFFVFGIVWIVPAAMLIRWMQRPD